MNLMICIVARVVADLDFAQMQNVFHPVFKTANIMYEPDSDTVKITDFGIARITNSSKTETDMVLGIPSCMSLEQLAGKKADGRTDLFSLGLMLYQLLSGALRFKANFMASLMFKIGNEVAADIRSACADTPGDLANVINKAPPRNVGQRFRSGADYASAAKDFLKSRS